MGKCCSKSEEWDRDMDPSLLTPEQLNVTINKFVDQYCPHGSNVTAQQKENIAKAIKEGDPATFSDSIMHITEYNAEKVDSNSPIVPNRFKMTTEHVRFDQEAPKSITDGSDGVAATFVANLIIGRYVPTDGVEVPKHVGMRSLQAVRESLETISLLDDGTYSKGEFYIEDQGLLKGIYEQVHDIDWDKAVTACYAVAPQANGTAYSPAWNACYLVFQDNEYKSDDEAVIWILQSALADGTAASKYPGLALGDNAWYTSRVGTHFTPLSKVDNWFGYRMRSDFVRGNEDAPPSLELLEFTVKCFQEDGGQPTLEEMNIDIGEDGASKKMYLQVSNVMQHATEDDLKSREEKLFKNLESSLIEGYATLIKGALMYDLVELYFPDIHNPGKLFELVNQAQNQKVTLGDELTGCILSVFGDDETRHNGLWVVPPGPGRYRTNETRDTHRSNIKSNGVFHSEAKKE